MADLRSPLAGSVRTEAGRGALIGALIIAAVEHDLPGGPDRRGEAATETSLAEDPLELVDRNDGSVDPLSVQSLDQVDRTDDQPDKERVPRDHNAVEASGALRREGREALPVRVHVEDSIQGHDVHGLDRRGQIYPIAMVIRDAVGKSAPIALTACRR